MKKIVLGTLGVFIGSLLLVSCSSESSVLSSFSKRKYLKNFKESKKTYEVNIEEQIASVDEIKESKSNESNASNSVETIEEFKNDVVLTQATVQKAIALTPKKVSKQLEKEYRNWDKFNRNYSVNYLSSREENLLNLFKLLENNNEPRTHWSAIVSLILGILGGFGGLIFGVVALIVINDNPQKHKGKGLAYAGIILSLLFLLILLALMS